MKIKYIRKNFHRGTLELIEKASEIADEFLQDGFKLTLRQLYYQFVSRDEFPNDRCWRWTGSKWKRNSEGTKNAQPNYIWLKKTLTDARNAGLFDWNILEDRTRNISSNPHWDSTTQAIEDIAAQFHFDLWAEQNTRVQVWIEKDALSGVFEPVCQELDVPLMACRGYPSASEVWSAGRRFREYRLFASQDTVILHFGDHDPSGIDMTRDLVDRLSMYAEYEGVTVKRIALNMEQIKKYNPPPDPAKTTDSRFREYAANFGDSSWELDALKPKVLQDLARDEITKYIGGPQWRKSVQRQEDARERLHEIAVMESLKDD